MKILYHHRIASKDGQFVHVEELTQAFLRQGHELTIVAPAMTETSEFGDDAGVIAKLKKRLPAYLYEVLEFCYSFLIFVKLIRAIKQNRPDIIYERYNLYQPAGIWASKLFSIPLLLEINAPLVEERAKYSGLSLHKFASWSQRYTWKNATCCFPVSNVLADYLRAAGVNEEQITIIHNGVRASFIEEMSSRFTRHDSSTTTVGFTGFIHPWHGMDMAIRALADYRDQHIKLICVGDGNILPELKALARELDLEQHVEFTGHLPRSETLSRVREFDIALQPDVTDYASPLKMFEYMAVGSVIIAPDSKNIREILDDSCGLFFEKGNKDDFIRVLRKALELKGDRRQFQQSAMQQIYRKRFIWDENAKKVIQIAKNIMLTQE